MTEIESAKIIIKQNGRCDYPVYIECDDCPAERIKIEKGFNSCGDLWGFDDDYDRKQWFENFLKENDQNECKVIVNDNIEEKLDKIIKLLEDIKNEN